NMLRLAQRGVTFSNGYAASPVCSPSRAAIMTGKSAAHIGITDYIGSPSNAVGSRVGDSQTWIENMPASEVLLPEAVQAAGYATGFFGKWHLGQAGHPAADPLQSGFNVNVGGTNAGNPQFAGGFFAGADGAWFGMPGLSTLNAYPADAYLSDALSAEAASFIRDRASADEPFLAVVSLYVVHTPIQAPASLVGYYSNKIAALTPGEVDGHGDATYAAMVHKMDEALGRLLDALDDPDADGGESDSIAENTIVVFTADNGGLTNFAITSNRPFSDGKGSMYEGGIREPLILAHPGAPTIAQGAVSHGNAIGYDIYPTLLDLLGVEGDLEQNDVMDGISLRPALEDPVGGEAILNDRDLYWHYPHRSPQAVTANAPVSGGAWVSAVRRGAHKLLYFYDERSFERYNVGADLGESSDLFPNDPASSASLAESLYGHLRRVNAPMPRDLGSNTELPGPGLIDPAFGEGGQITFDDSFDVPHDFVVDGVAGTGWDAVDSPGRAAILDADTTQSGVLTFRNAGDTRVVAGDLAAPRLRTSVTGDFQATMQITGMDDVNFHVLTMLVTDPGDPMNEFLWIGQQNRSGANDFAQARNIVAGERTADVGENGVFEYYRLVRTGSSFVGMFSSDGLLWIPFVDFERPDLPRTVDLSLTQALFSSSPASGTIARFQVIARCEADIADPAGTLDERDVVSFIQSRPESFFDLLQFLNQYDACE
ncbi:MAG: sulfatase-like hydrolase/transferase, partial [Planctomycetota bacterium]